MFKIYVIYIVRYCIVLYCTVAADEEDQADFHRLPIPYIECQKLR